MTLRFVDVPSPNFDRRDPAVKLDYIVLHYTGMATGEEALQRLQDPAAKVSAHYVIAEDGTVYRMVDEAKRAWHAGKSFWRDVTDLNSASIGIELINPGHDHGYVAFPAAQIAVLKQLLGELIARHGFDPQRCLLGHSDIAPARKMDPGELFPWRELAEAGFGIWPVIRDEDHAPVATGEVDRLLAKIGYEITPDTLHAFQRRYDPQRLNGQAEASTIALLRGLARTR